MDATLPAKGAAPVAGMEEDGSPRRSFAQVLGKAMKDDLDDKPTDSTTFRKEGSPALRLSDSDVERGESHVSNHIVVMKFSSLRPSLDSIRESIHRSWRISGEFIMGLIDPRHVMVYLQSENEVKKVLSNDFFMIRGVRYKMFRWHPGFSLRADPELAPIWIELPNLPFAFFLPAIMKAIGDSFGNFLRIDDGTRYFARPKIARMCVEMEVSKPLPHRIWLESSKYGGYWQKLEYPGFKYCDHCSLVGHEKDYCRKLVSRKQEQSKVDGETNLGNKPLDKDKQKQNQVGGKQDQSVKMQTHVPVAKKMVETKGNIGTSNSQGAEIITEVDIKRPVDNEPVKVVLSNKFESLTENFEEDVCVPANRQLVGKETTHDYAADGPESTEECLIEAGYTISEIEKACGKQELTLQQEDGGESGAVSRGAAGVDLSVVSAGQADSVLPRAASVAHNEGQLPNSPTAPVSPLPVTDAPKSVVSIVGSGCFSVPTMEPTNPKELMPVTQEAGYEIVVQENNGIHGQNRDSGTESASIATVNTQEVSAVDVAKLVQSEQLASATPLGGHHGDTNTELGDAMQGQQVHDPYDDNFQSLLKLKKQFDKHAIKSSPDYKRAEEFLNTTIARCKENRLYPIPHFELVRYNEDSDEVNSEAEIGPQVACSDLELGATSNGEMKKRHHTKDVSLGPRKSNRNKKANKRYKD